MDTHALSVPAFASALEVLAANGVETMVDSNGGYTPTPAISHAILTYNRGRKSGLADGIVITPSHNPPADGGFKYNPPNGGPADTAVTDWIQNTANDFLEDRLAGVQRVPYERALTVRDASQARLHQRLCRRPRQRRRHGIDSQRRRARSESIRWAARRCTTGRR